MNNKDIPYYRLLTLDLPTETKYFLAVFLHEFGCEGHSNLKAQELSKTLGLNSSTAKKSIDLLVDKGFLHREKIKHATGGRPSYKYTSSEQLNQHLTQLDNLENDCHYEVLIGKVLSKSFSMRKKDNQSVLKPPAKVLLAALLLRANKLGVVKNLKKADLEELTGMSKERLKSQIRLLSKTKYLSLYIHGMASTPIFGSTKSIYRLDLESLSIERDLPRIILYCKNAYHFINQTAPDEEERADDSNFYDENDYPPPYPINIDDHLPQRTIDNIKKLLAFKIHTYAIDALRDGFDKDAPDKETSDQQIKDKLKEEFFTEASTENSSLTSIPKATQNDLIEWGFMVLSHIANKVIKTNQEASIHHDLKKAICIEAINPQSIIVSMEK